MKLLILIGASIGFTVGLAPSFLQQKPWASSLWHASITACLSGLLLKWWGHAWLRNLHLALQDKDSKPLPSQSHNQAKR